MPKFRPEGFDAEKIALSVPTIGVVSTPEKVESTIQPVIPQELPPCVGCGLQADCKVPADVLSRVNCWTKRLEQGKIQEVQP